MKKILLGIMLILSFLGCGREIDSSKVKDQDGTIYAIGENKPYSGAVTLKVGEINTKTFYKDGKLDLKKQIEYNQKMQKKLLETIQK